MTPEEILKQRRFWGIDPRAVTRHQAEADREHAALRARIGDFETRVASVTAQRDESVRRAANEQSALQQRITDLEKQLTLALSRAEMAEAAVIDEREPKERVAILREEAMRFAAESWAKAQAVEEHTQQLVERTRGELLAEAAKMRAARDEERHHHLVELDRLAKQRAQLLSELEATARGLLDHATVIRQRRGAGFISPLDLALQTLGADAMNADDAAAVPDALPDPDDAPARNAAKAPDADPAESARDAAVLTSALDNLEALLKLPREHWEGRPASADVTD